MRLKLTTAIAALLVSLGVVATTPTSAVASGGDLSCRISAVDDYANYFQRSRTYMSSHRSTYSWKRYLPEVNSAYYVANCFVGGGATAIRSSQQRFNSYYSGQRWSDGIAELDYMIKALRQVVRAYYDSDANGCKIFQC
ncbi:hypothetical protein [Aeromicrobium fastidiosum]|uniref:Secreted protein n=1 Tax=Aeromicrobium fastidiosum TaxID=52699 RepID=A0A641AK86_9ACTN|nr:hypothetical protein [Aeromicrobium fastidiosum]KAA1376237.1 hypothetical protein ESP62_012420 [Aeromicrobium fastidiosum]MBP2391873.1 hypothetical protein [Aeromicrobium fastidiosum]